MSLIVQKFGGTSVGSLERIREVAKRVAQTRAQGHQVIVVVSAIAGETNRLLALGRELSARPNEREMDVLVATGEQVSASLTALALIEIGVPACSLLGHQARIVTDHVHTKARIEKIECDRLHEALKQGSVPVVAGFQGIDHEGNITTLGRGGTDTTAVAIAAAVQADICEIYTDVDGVYTTDPNVCPSARKIGRISYDEMLELASLGAKVLQLRSVELAMKYGVPVHVRSSFNSSEGTMVIDDKSLESVVVSGVAADKSEVKLTVRGLHDQPGVVAQLFEALAERAISVDMIIQNISEQGTTDLTFTVKRDDLDKTHEITSQVASGMGARQVLVDQEIAKISVVGLGMRSHAGVASRMFRILAARGINIEAISTSEIKISCIIRQSSADDAVRALHEGFALGG